MTTLSMLISRLAQLSFSSRGPVTSTHIFHKTTNRFFSTSGSACRKLDSHAYPPSKLPSSRNNRWEELKPFHEMYEYTTKPLPFPKTGGRGPNGRIWNHRRAGGHKRKFRMIDWSRCGQSDDGHGQTRIERVNRILYDPNRSARIALVAEKEKWRYIVATENMKPGDLIQSSNVLVKTPIRPNEGDSHPLGSLPIGTSLNCVEKYPGDGALLARAAGVSATLVRKQDDGMCVVRLPSKRDVVLLSDCTATVGRVSNVDHNKRVIGKAGRNRWLGIRPKSGLWHRKTGYCGRKIHAIKKPVVYTKPRPPKPVERRFTLPSVPGVYESRAF